MLDHKLQLAERAEVENEQYSRKNSVRIFNLPAPRQNEDSRAVVCEFANTKLQLEPPLVPHDIDICHRVAVKSPRHTQMMICKFVRRTNKIRILKIRTKLASTGLGVADDIAKQHLDFMDGLKKRADVAEVWFFNGKIFCKPVGTENSFNPRLHCNVETWPLKDFEMYTSMQQVDCPLGKQRFIKSE